MKYNFIICGDLKKTTEYLATNLSNESTIKNYIDVRNALDSNHSNKPNTIYIINAVSLVDKPQFLMEYIMDLDKRKAKVILILKRKEEILALSTVFLLYPTIEFILKNEYHLLQLLQIIMRIQSNIYNQNGFKKTLLKSRLPIFKGRDRVLFLNKEKISFIRKEGNKQCLVKYVTANGYRTLITDKSFNYHKNLEIENFFQVHNQCLINVLNIETLSRNEKYEFTMQCGELIPASKRRFASFVKFFSL